MTFRFEPETHRYYLGRERLISVTESFKLAGMVDDRWFTDFGRLRGTAVHKAVQYLIEDDLDFGSLDPIIKPYVSAAVDFLKWAKFTPFLSLCETPQVNEEHGYAGTPDLVGLIGSTPTLLDIKTGSCDCAHIQTAAYAEMPKIKGLRPLRYTLKLNNTGTFRLLPHVGVDDFTRFLRGLSKARDVLRETTI